MPRHKWDPRSRVPHDLLRPAPVDASGENGPTRGRAAGPKWRRTSSGMYVPSDTPDDVPEQRILEASLRLPPLGAVTGWAACRIYGAAFHDGLQRDGITPIPVQLAVGHRGGVRRVPEITVSFEALKASEVTIRHGIPVVPAERAVFDEMRRTGDLREAVVALDMAAAGEIASIQEVAIYTTTRVGARRISVNCPIYDRTGRLLGIADLLDEEAGLVIEFDGAEHRGVHRQGRDAVKDGDLRDADLEVVRVTGPQLSDVDTLVRRLLAARRRSKFLPADQRAWLAVPPADDLHERLASGRDFAEREARWLREQSG